MSYRGHIEKGRIVLDEAVELPEGAVVTIDLIADANLTGLHPDVVRFTGIIPEDVDARREYRESMESKYR